MDKRTFQRLLSFIVFKSFLALLLFNSSLSAPIINSTISYDIFLKNITRDNCAFPNGIVLPFKDSTVSFKYFSELLKICQAPEAMKRSLEAITLCSEIYESLRNVTCHPDKNVQLPEIKIDFSDNVCNDISALQLKHELKEKGLLQHLTDKFICEIMCEDDFLPACKMLLWSFQLQKRIEEISSITKSPEQEGTDVKDGAFSSVTNQTLKPNQVDEVKEEEQQPLKSKQGLPVIENPDFNNELDDDKHINDDTNKGELEQPMKNNKDNQYIVGENEIPEEEPNLTEKKDNDLSGKQDQSLKTDTENQPQQNVNKDNAGDGEKKVEIPLVDNKHTDINKINVDETPTKLSPDKSVYTNKPAVTIAEVNSKTEPKKALVNNLPTASQKEIQEFKPIDITKDNTSNSIKPVLPVVNELPEIVSQLPTSSKVSSVKADESKVSIKPEVTQQKEDDVADVKKIPTIGKEDVVSITTVADLEKMEEGNGLLEPGDKELDQYSFILNDDVNSEGGVEYDEDGFYDTLNKKQEEPDNGKIISKPTLAEIESPKYDVFPQRNSFGRSPDDIQVISAFPEQEDSHFFFYFLSLVLILMAGYLLFHNKQKIIALIVEGRHERRRRSHGVGYKKLETK